MDRSEELRLPTIAVPVRLARVGGAAVELELFVADIPRRGRSELLDDLSAVLDAEAGFVPVRCAGAVQLLGKHAIAWIAIARRDPDEPPSRDFSSPEPSEVFMLYDRQHRVEIELALGGKLAGTFLDSSPSDRPRVIDHLNRAVRFVRLWTLEDHVFVNVKQIVSVIESSEGV